MPERVSGVSRECHVQAVPFSGRRKSVEKKPGVDRYVPSCRA